MSRRAVPKANTAAEGEGTPVSRRAVPKANTDVDKTSGLDTLRTIAWSFLGIRRRKDHDRESGHINPIHVVVAGFVGVLILVAGLILLVNLVAAK